MLKLTNLFTNYAEFQQLRSKVGKVGMEVLVSELRHTPYGDVKTSYFISPRFARPDARENIWHEYGCLDGLLYLSRRRLSYNSGSGRIYDLAGWSIRLPFDCTIDTGGVCLDGDTACVRYIKEDGRVYKMKAGKFLRRCVEASGATAIGPKALNQHCEDFAREWSAFASTKVGEYAEVTLKYDQDFEFIYCRDNYAGDGFGSCMTNEGYEGFYNEVDGARAASLVNTDGLILSRCIVFEKCISLTDGRTYRVAERQYAMDGGDAFKQMLVDALIKADKIDAYKRIGADCRSPKAFVSLDGGAFNPTMYIQTYIKTGNLDATISYQDSFKYLDVTDGRAYNEDEKSGLISLEITSGALELNHDQYNDEWTTDEVTDVYIYRRGRWIEQSTTYGTRDELFTYVRGYGYYYSDDCFYNDLLDEYIPLDLEEDIYAERGVQYDEIRDEYTFASLTPVLVACDGGYTEQMTDTNLEPSLYTYLDGELFLTSDLTVDEDGTFSRKDAVLESANA